MPEPTADTPAAQSALHPIYLSHAAAMEIRTGWHIPARFSSIDAELAAARETVAMGERFGGTTVDLVGAALDDCAARLHVGQVPLGAAAPVKLPDADEARWLRLIPSHARLQVTGVQAWAPRSGRRSGVQEQLTQCLNARTPGRPNACLHLTDISSSLTTLAVIGPRSPDLLARLVRLDLDPRVFANHTVALTGAAGIPLQLLRWDRGPHLTYELTVGRDVAEYWWETLIHAGVGLGLQPIGTEALDQLDRGSDARDA